MSNWCKKDTPGIPKSLYMPETYEDLIAYNEYLKSMGLPKKRIEGISYYNDSLVLSCHPVDRNTNQVNKYSLFNALLTYLSHPEYYFSNPHMLKKEYSHIKNEFYAVVNSVLNPKNCREQLKSYLNNTILIGKSDIDVGGLKIRNKEGDKWELTEVEGERTVVYLPEFIDIIGKEVFVRKSRGIEMLISYSAALSIKPYAFNHSKLKEIITFGAIKQLSAGSFCFCTDLSYIWLSDTMQEIPSTAFFKCSSLELINLPSGLLWIGYKAFSFAGIKIERLPSAIEGIGYEAFRGCENIKRMDFTNAKNLSEICESAFAECINLTSIIFNDNNKLAWIEPLAFAGCWALKRAVFDGDMVLNRFSESLFDGDGSLELVVPPVSLRVIEKEVFNGCNSLNSIDMSHTKIRLIMANAFYDDNCKISIRRIIVQDRERVEFSDELDAVVKSKVYKR